MKTTITVRLDQRQHEALAEAARKLGKSVSEVVRDALAGALTERTIATRAGHLKGSLRLPRRARTRWRDEIRARNWRP